MTASRFYVLAAQRHWIVLDRRGKVLCLAPFRSKRRALRFAACLEREHAMEADNA